ncbi:transglutaminase-like domain-containing protein [Brachybacterium sillae]|uniref:transglutaminase-like domain-containing protein n=1 Tax=Brachybacterium sillae TaxID=2810536 RepID=UPI00217EB3FE|nr:transglutaminase family protein [Brachybacterium sillae]
MDQQRHLYARLGARVAEGTSVALLIAVSASTPVGEERFEARLNGEDVPVEETTDPFGNRLHILRDLPAGDLDVEYEAQRAGQAAPAPVEAGDDAVYLRPSRYCEVDKFAAPAAEIVGGREGQAAVDAVVAWVYEHLSYVPGSSTITDSARSTWLSRKGVCRDYAHVTATLLRAAGIPARCVSVYAPGLSPMDFHLVVEALVDGAWQVVDATHMAPRESMVRIATGFDAADTAFSTTLHGDLRLTSLRVLATVDPELPREVWAQAVPLR